MMPIALGIYFTIGFLVALGFTALLEDPPEYDSEWELLRDIYGASPSGVGIPLFVFCVLLWPFIFLA